MKKLTLLFLVGGVFSIIVGTASSVQANTYASDLKVTFDGNFLNGPAIITFTLNDSATSVVVRIKQGATTIKTIDAGPRPKGHNTVLWDGTADVGIAPVGDYSFEVQTTGPNYATWTMFFDSGGISIFTRGVDVNRDPKQRDFGYIYAASNGGPLARGILRFRADGVPAGGDTLGGYIIKETIDDWIGSTSPQRVYFATIDWRGWVWVTDPDSGETKTAVRVFKPSDKSVTKVISGVKWPFGLAVQDTGAAFKLYVAANTYVLRYNLGTSLTPGPPDTVAKLGTRVIDVILDDAGFMYVNLRAGTTRDGTSAGGISTEKYNISGTLPVTRADSLWSVKWTGSRPVGLGINRGANLTSNADDKLYVSVAEGAFGVYEISGIASPPTKTRIFNPPLGDISSRADLTVDVAGNVIFFENNNEHVYFLSPPGGSPYTTPGIDGITVTTPLPVELASFTANVSGTVVDLRWTTMSESNNYGFNVERSRDKVAFEKVGFVPGHGTTTTPHEYRFVDQTLQERGVYYYRLKQIDTDGSFVYSNIVSVKVGLPSRFALHQNYPNPFNPSTTIRFDLPEASRVVLKIYNVVGQEVATLVDENLPAGSHSAVWNAQSVPSGVYFYRLQAGRFSEVRKMMFVK